MLKILPCIDSEEMGFARRQELVMSRQQAVHLGETAVEAAADGYYLTRTGERVDWHHQVENAIESKVSIRPSAKLPRHTTQPERETVVQVTNETTCHSPVLGNVQCNDLLTRMLNALQRNATG